MEYYNEKVANGIMKTNHAFVLLVLIKLCENFPVKKFEGISKQEIVFFHQRLKPKKHVLPQKHGGVVAFEKVAFSDNTLWRLKAAFKTFYHQFFGVGLTDTLPEAVSWIQKEGYYN